MKCRVPGPAVGILVALASAAILTEWVQAFRPFVAGAGTDVELVVNHEGDRGPGSLREAFFAANSAPSRARIVLVTDRVVLRTPLPPLVNPDGVQLASDGSPALIDASALAYGPVLDIRAEGSVLRRVALSGAPSVAIAVRAAGVLLDSIRVVDSQVAVLHLDGRALAVVGSSFERNGIGLDLASEAPDVHVRSNLFVGHRQAGVWATGAPSPGGAAPARVLRIVDNRFDGDRVAIVLGNRNAMVTDNRMVGSREVGLYLAGEGVRVRENRILRGEGYGILAVGAIGAEISDNEADGNRAVGILLNSSQSTLVSGNRSYRNGYGIVAVFGDPRNPDRLDANTAAANGFDGVTVVGSSPLLRGNQVIGNRLAGLRVLDYQPRTGPRIRSDPLLGANELRGNGLDELVRGVYLEPPPSGRE